MHPTWPCRHQFLYRLLLFRNNCFPQSSDSCHVSAGHISSSQRWDHGMNFAFTAFWADALWQFVLADFTSSFNSVKLWVFRCSGSGQSPSAVSNVPFSLQVFKHLGFQHLFARLSFFLKIPFQEPWVSMFGTFYFENSQFSFVFTTSLWSFLDRCYFRWGFYSLGCVLQQCLISSSNPTLLSCLL